MKKVKVIVKEKHLLELLEDAEKGDIIDLKDVMEIDESFLNQLIDEGKDKIYENRLKQVKEQDKENQLVALDKLKHQMEVNQKDQELVYIKKEQEIKTEYEKLNNEYQNLKSQFQLQLNNSRLMIEKDYQKRITQLEQDIYNFKKDKEILQANFEKEKEKALSLQKDEFNKKLSEKENQINQLQRAKANMNVKQTGEDLESWCNNEVLAYMQNGFFNCTWIKDNKVIKEEDEQKGSKADYIFNIYVNEKHIDKELLASVCMDMKDENPDSVNKKNNADYYKQLDKNRIKKNCKYALLVSNLEIEKPNVLPIFKVREYEDMYVVRPAYLMVFLNMLVSLTTRFSNLLQSQETEIVELKEKEALMKEFNEIKNTYLDKPLESLAKDIEEIRKNSKIIRDASQKIDEQCDKMNLKYIHIIQDKINRFELGLRKINKKLQ